MNRVRMNALRKLLAMAEYGPIVYDVNGETRELDIERDSIDFDAGYRIQGSAITPIRPGQVWRTRLGRSALVLQQDDLGGFPQKEITYWDDNPDESGFYRCDEFGRVGQDESEMDLVELISEEPAGFFG